MKIAIDTHTHSVASGHAYSTIEELAKRLDFVMAGLHEICFHSRDRAGNTAALMAALANPLVDAISHPGNPAFPIDIEAVVIRAAELGKALEVNDSSFRVRAGSDENCLAIARACVIHGCSMVCGSDAHFWEDLGRLDTAKAHLLKVDAPASLVVNSTVKGFETFLIRRRGAIQSDTSSLAAKV